MYGAPARIPSFPVPVLLIASVVLVSVLGWLAPSVKRALMLNPYLVRRNGQVYRLLTAGWVHGGVTHLAFNMFSLYFFADQALHVLGVTRFLVLYISAVIMGFIPTTLRYMERPQYSSLGASGAVTAVMFSAILLLPKLKLYVMFLPIPVPGLVFAAGYLVFSVVSSLRAADNIDHTAHFAGAIYGALFTYAFEPALVERTLKSLV